MADEKKPKKDKKKHSDLSDAAAKLGAAGGIVGGRRRAEELTAEERSKIAKSGADARWGKAKHEVNKKKGKKSKGDDKK